MRKKSLSHKIITGFLVSFCLPLVVFLIFWVYQIGKIQEENVERQIENDIAGILSEIAYRVQEMDTIARSLAANPQIIDYLSNYSQEPEKYLLEAMGNFGSFIASVDQINPRIEAMRIYALDEAIPRYQNTIYPKRVMAQKAWMQRLEHLGYDAYFIGKSAKLYSAQNDENYRELIFPRNEMGPSVFSMYRQIYGVGSTKPVGYLEICMRTEDMVDLSDMRQLWNAMEQGEQETEQALATLHQEILKKSKHSRSEAAALYTAVCMEIYKRYFSIPLARECQDEFDLLLHSGAMFIQEEPEKIRQAVTGTVCRISEKLGKKQEENIIIKAKKLIHERPEWSLNELADALHISSGYLSTLYHKETGKPLGDTLIQERILKACNLLCTTRYTVEQIARQVGYTSEKHFFVVFKKNMGVSPARYRKEYHLSGV